MARKGTARRDVPDNIGPPWKEPEPPFTSFGAVIMVMIIIGVLGFILGHYAHTS